LAVGSGSGGWQCFSRQWQLAAAVAVGSFSVCSRQRRLAVFQLAAAAAVGSVSVCSKQLTDDNSTTCPPTG